MKFWFFVSDKLRGAGAVMCVFTVAAAGIFPLALLSNLHRAHNHERYVTVEVPVSYYGPVVDSGGKSERYALIKFAFTGFGGQYYSGQLQLMYPVGNDLAAITEDMATGRAYDNLSFQKPGPTPMRLWQYAVFVLVAGLLGTLSWLGCVWLSRSSEVLALNRSVPPLGAVISRWQRYSTRLRRIKARIRHVVTIR